MSFAPFMLTDQRQLCKEKGIQNCGHQEHKFYLGWALTEKQGANLQQNYFICMICLNLDTG